MSTIRQVMNAQAVAGLMGVEGLAPIAWALIQEESQGTTREVIAQGLGVRVDELTAVVDMATGREGDESQAVWQQGIIALKVSRMMNEGTVSGGWDAAEAMALEKLNNQLNAMQGNGSPSEMLSIAVAANKAIRRRRGEGSRPMGNPLNPNGGQSQVGIDLTLRSGELGTLQLRLGPALQEQMAKRTIDITPNQPAGGALNLEMLKLKETRELVNEITPKSEGGSALDKRFDFSAMMTDDIPSDA